MTQEDSERIAMVAGRAFSPGSPIREKDVFAGRRKQIRRVFDAITQDGKSILIYGERGVGKTSLANVIGEVYSSVAATRIFAPHVACDTEDSFNSIWRKVLNEKDRSRPQVTLSDDVKAKIDQLLDSTADLSPHHIKMIADMVTQTHLLIPIIDEFDRVADEYAIALFTDTIKYLSDHTRNTTLVLVGVGDTVDDLISEHQSVERSLEQVLMPRMSAEESAEILKSGELVTSIRFSSDATALIAALAQGLPHYTHTLGLNATRSAADDLSWTVEERHVESATVEAIASSQQSLVRSYHSATSSPRPDNLYRQVLLACSLAETDELGYFTAANVRGPMSRIMNKPYDIPSYSQHLKHFCEPDRGAVLQRHGKDRKVRFRFANSLFQPYVIMQGLNDRHITKQDVRGMFKATPPPSGGGIGNKA